MDTPSHKTINKNEIKQGLFAAWPICLGYIPLGIACGVLAQKAGISPLQIGFMSLLVFAGSGQFIAISMLGGGAVVASIVVTTAVVNLRHLLMSSSLAIYLGRARGRKLSLFAAEITDETFAVNISRFKNGGWDIRQGFIVNATSHLAWTTSTIIGAYSGQFIPEGAFGIDYALCAMFIGLLALQFRGQKYVITVVLAGALALIFSLLLPGNLYVIIASIIATTLVVAFRRRMGKESARV